MKRYVYTIITVPVFGLLYVYTTFSILFGSFLVVLGMKTTVGFLSCYWAKSVFWAFGKKVHVKGKKNLVKGEKYILIANHSSLFDIIAIMSFYPEISWFGREYLLKIPLLGFYLRKTGYIPMKTANFRNTKEMLERLVQKSDGRSIAIFPEGTRTLDGKINRFHRGFVHVLKASELDILPVTLNGLYSLKPKNRFYINFSSKISVVIHKPLKNEELIMKNDDEIIKIVKEVIGSVKYN